jgi:pimeloyl-ACP methyl ester carboxylesterase
MDAGAWILLILILIAAVIGGLMWFSRSTARKAEAAVPQEGRVTRVRGGAIHWISRGEGPPLLMIHGLAGQLQHWTYGVIPRLENDFRCIAIDRPGCGYSERDGDELADLREQARMIVEFLDTEGIERPLVVGHSLGGALALTLALEHSDRVAGLALVAPLTHPMEGSPDAFRPLAIGSPLMRRIIGGTLAVPMSLRNSEATLAMVFDPETAPEDFVTRGGGALGLRPRAFVSSSADFVAVPDAIEPQSRRYETLDLPGGILYGDSDAILPWESQGRALADRLTHFEWELLPGRGHMLPITAPEETAAFIRRVARAADLG